MSHAIAPVSLVPFEYGTTTVRTIVRDGEPWVVAADICAVLSIADARQAVERVDQADRCQAPVRSGAQNRQMWIVNESGLYDLIIRSDKPEAKPFRRWITSKVLPALRKTGRYEVAALSPRELAQLVLAEADRADAAEAKAAALEPAADAWNHLAEGTGDYSVAEAAQMLCRAGIPTGQNKLFATLRHIGWVAANGRPYQKQVNAGRLAARTSTYTHPHSGEPVLSFQVRITPKGVEWLLAHLGDGGFPFDLVG